MAAKKVYPLRHIDVDQLCAVPWNVNKMDEAEFQRLCQEMSELGCITALQVIPRPDGKYDILGGEHRWMAAKHIGLESVPCLVLEGTQWSDPLMQKIVAFRSNWLHGKPDPDKFMQLQKEIAEKYGAEQVQGMLAVTDAKAFAKLVGGIKKGLAQSLPKGLKGSLDQLDKANTVQDLSRIVQDIVNKHGSSVEQSYMVFTHGGQTHVYVPLDADRNKMLRALVRKVEQRKLNMLDVLGPALAHALEHVDEVQPRAARVAPAVEPGEPDF